MALIIAGERSGVGKTTITLAILAFLARQTKQTVQAFKVGPDYIDPMFHTAVTGRHSRNLDPILTSPDYVRDCFKLHSSQTDYALIEGVMGLFDGVNLHDEFDYASTAHVARLLDIPVLLVLDCSRLSGSVAAIAHGFKTLDPRVQIAGVILNRVASDRHLELLKNALNRLNIAIFGVIRRQEAITIPDRHLGLIPTEELPEIKDIFARLAEIARTSFDWQKLLPLLKTTNKQQATSNKQTTSKQQKIKIAVARDRAFNFYYQDNLDILEQLGVEICFWSPLVSDSVPQDVFGLYFGGGFPEVFAPELASKQTLKAQLKQLIATNIPVYAECGGLMYLCDRLIDLNGKSWDMVGSIPAVANMTSKLTLGYRQATPVNSSFLIPCQPQTQIWGHEFHRSQLNVISPQPLWQLQGCHSNRESISEGWQLNNLHASYLHLHFGKSKILLKRWLDRCREYKNQLG